MNTSTDTQKRRVRPPMVRISDTPKKRGRPRRVKEKFFIENYSRRTLKLLSLKISKKLHLLPCLLTCQLAEAAIAYKSMSQVRKKAPLVGKREGVKGNRSNIHYSVLLWDIARIIEGVRQGGATKVLKKINGYNEDRAKANGKPSTAIADKYARVVLAALGERNPPSLRRQASNALKIQKIKMI